jgi:hypothetical protein
MNVKKDENSDPQKHKKYFLPCVRVYLCTFYHQQNSNEMRLLSYLSKKDLLFLRFLFYCVIKGLKTFSL